MGKAKGQAVLIGGRVYEAQPGGGLTSMKRSDGLGADRPDDQKQAAEFAASDADAAPMTDEEWARARVTAPVKNPVGLKLDDDALTWFKAQGQGCQTRINSVLRRYYETHRKIGRSRARHPA